MDSSGAGQKSMAGFCEHGNHPYGAIKDRVFPDYLTDYQPMKKNSAALRQLRSNLV
jgi:hypothetical protein